MKLRIGTRGSKLALWQANLVQSQLAACHIDSEIITFETKGDKILNTSISKIGSKGVFTEELEAALEHGMIDLAVHSAKDLQSQIDSKFEIISFSEREKAHDVLLAHRPTDIKEPLIIGTSSTRRVAFLKAYFPQWRVVDMRGNLQTRVSKMEAGHCDALMLAYAGVKRMGFDNKISYEFDNEIIVPPTGQGSVAIEVSAEMDQNLKKNIQLACNDPQTEVCVRAERAFLKTIEGGCSIPVFAHAALENQDITLTAGIISLDGKAIIKEILTEKMDWPEELGMKIALSILEKGGRSILDEIQKQK